MHANSEKNTLCIKMYTVINCYLQLPASNPTPNPTRNTTLNAKPSPNPNLTADPNANPNPNHRVNTYRGLS